MREALKLTPKDQLLYLMDGDPVVLCRRAELPAAGHYAVSTKACGRMQPGRSRRGANHMGVLALRTRLAGVRTVLLDTMVFAYHLADHPDYSP